MLSSSVSAMLRAGLFGFLALTGVVSDVAAQTLQLLLVLGLSRR